MRLPTRRPSMLLRALLVILVLSTPALLHEAPLRSGASVAMIGAGLQPPAFFTLPSDPMSSHDPGGATQYSFAQIRAGPVWSVPVEAPGSLVCVIDSGLRMTHEEIPQDRVVAVADFIKDRSTADGLHYHGTFVTSLAAGETGNGAGIAGFAVVDTAHARVLNETGWTWYDELAEGIRWCSDQPSERVVISISIGGDDEADGENYLRPAVAYARERGAVLVASAGNRNSQNPPCFDCITYPAALDGVIAVTSTSPGEVPSWWSSFGPQADIAAPGDVILGASSGADNEYTLFSGTSFSAPIVAAAIAIVWSANPDLSNDEIVARLYSTAQDIAQPGWDIHSGHGELDMTCFYAGTSPCRGLN